MAGLLLGTQKDVLRSPDKYSNRPVLPEKTSVVLGSSGRDSEKAQSSLDQETGGQTAKQFPPEQPEWGEKKQNIFPTPRPTPAIDVSGQ